MLDKSLTELTTVSNVGYKVTKLPDPDNTNMLEVWLDDNNCLEESKNLTLCYKQTRLKLIREVYSLDKVTDGNYEANQNVDLLKGNIITIKDSLDEQK